MIELRKMVSWDPYLPDLIYSRMGLRIDDYHIDSVETGMMNFVFRVRTDKGTFFLKQALARAKAHRSMGPALQPVSSRRLEYEKIYLSRIRAISPDGTKIPAVHHYDPDNRILLLGDVAGNGGALLETTLMEGRIDFSTAAAVGRFLGIVHGRTRGTQRSIRGSRRKDREHWERFLAMRTKAICTDSISPDIAEQLDNLYTLSLQRHSHDVLMWMDGCPKNVLVRKNGDIGVIDFELACAIGDPAYDLGFFLGHYLIHAIVKNETAASLQAIAGAIDAYSHALEGAIVKDGTAARALKFAAATVCYRVAGASCLVEIKPEFIPHLMGKAGTILGLEFRGETVDAISLLAGALTEDG